MGTRSYSVLSSVAGKTMAKLVDVVISENAQRYLSFVLTVSLLHVLSEYDNPTNHQTMHEKSAKQNHANLESPTSYNARMGFVLNLNFTKCTLRNLDLIVTTCGSASTIRAAKRGDLYTEKTGLPSGDGRTSVTKPPYVYIDSEGHSYFGR